MSRDKQDLPSKRKGVLDPITLLPYYPLAYGKWRITFTNGDVVVRKFHGLQHEVIDAFYDVATAVPIGRPLDDF